VDVKIDHRAKGAGFFRRLPRYDVYVSVKFEEWELDVIYGANLYDFLVAKRKTHPESGSVEDNHLILRHLIEQREDGFAFTSFPAAKAYEAEVLEGLARIKQLIEASRDASMTRTERL
jgi:hypothetical protein